MEAGVHRLVRISPFSAKKLRHTAFALLEVIPRFVAPEEIKIDDKDLRVDLMKSGGAGGQNVNKRETAVRLVHLPTGIAVHVDAERSQGQNKERAMEILKSKLYKLQLEEQKEEKDSMRRNKGVGSGMGASDTVVCFSSLQNGERPSDGSRNGQCGCGARRRIGRVYRSGAEKKY